MRTFLAIIVATMFAFAGLAAAQSQENTGVQRPVQQREIDRLKRQIEQDSRSSVEAVFDYHTESGNLNQKLDFFRYGGRLNLKTGASSSLQLTGTRTNYLPISPTFREQGTNLTAGLHSKLGEYTQAHVEVGATRFTTDTSTINGSGSITFSHSDNTHFYVEASRSNIEESLLSATGIRPVIGPFAGRLVGRVMENRFVGGGSSRLFDHIDIFAEGGAGNRAGSNVPSNFFKTFTGGAGYSVIARPDGEPLSLLRAAYELTYFGFDEDRFGFGGASLLTRNGLAVNPARIGSDGMSPNPSLTTAGLGGYFSPKNFASNVIRVEAKGGSDDSVSYQISGFLGSQIYTGSSRRLADGLSATVNVALTERLSLPVTYLIDNFGPFAQQSLFARLAVRF